MIDFPIMLIIILFLIIVIQLFALQSCFAIVIRELRATLSQVKDIIAHQAENEKIHLETLRAIVSEQNERRKRRGEPYRE